VVVSDTEHFFYLCSVMKRLFPQIFVSNYVLALKCLPRCNGCYWGLCWYRNIYSKWLIQ